MPRKRSPKNIRTPGEKIADALDISKEILLNTSKISAIGSREVTVENYKGILEYNPNIIRLTAKDNQIKISGECLEIKTMTRDFLFITGKIRSVQFCTEGR